MLKWQAYRIPQTERKFALGRWYTHRLRVHVQRHNWWMDAIRSLNEQNADFQKFLTTMGVDDAEIKQHSQCNQQAHPQAAANVLDFLHFGEREAVELIAISAQSLKNRKPFQDHPANKDLPVKKGKGWPGLDKRGLKSISPAPAAVEQTSAPEGEAHCKGRRETRWLGRMADTHRTSIQGIDLEQEKSKALDAEELWKRFTPRLWEISDAADNANGGAGGTSAGAETSAR